MNVMIAVIGLRWRTNRSLLDTLLTPVGDQLPPPSDSRMQGLIRPSVSWRRAAVLTTAIAQQNPRHTFLSGIGVLGEQRTKEGRITSARPARIQCLLALLIFFFPVLTYLCFFFPFFLFPFL